MNRKYLHTRPTNIRVVLIICIAILFICTALTAFSTMKLQSKTSDTVRQYADVFISKLSDELSNNNSHMENTIFTSSYRNMYYDSDMVWIEKTGTLLKSYKLLNDCSINHYNYFAFNKELDHFLEITAVKMPFSEYRHIRNEIKELARGSVKNGAYSLYEMPGGQRVILTMWAYEDFICGSWITEDVFLAGLDHVADNNMASFRLVDIAEQEDGYYIYELDSVPADFYVRMRIDPDPGLAKILIYQIAQLLLMVLGMVMLSVSVAAVHKNLLEPIQNLSDILNKYKKKIKSYDAVKVEFSDALNDTYTVLSRLGEELETMSVRLYEAELEKRQLNINFRNLQIRPHFLVNNLATIHDMAQLNETQKIMDLTVMLSNYYRYVLRDCMEMVPLWQELRHMENIIKVYREWSGNDIHLQPQIQEEVKNTQIPVLLISTFLENSIKHATNDEGGLNILVSAERREEFLHLCIRDDGGGFPVELLEHLTKNRLIPETDGRHIGINNAIQRIRLIYGNTAKIAFSNHADGAVVEIWLPIGG